MAIVGMRPELAKPGSRVYIERRRIRAVAELKMGKLQAKRGYDVWVSNRYIQI